MTRQGRLVAAATLALLALGACAVREEYRGHKTDPESVDLLQPGKQTQDDVRRLLGSPSSMSTFNQANNTWYYIARETEQWAFAAEEMVDQRVVAIDFDADGKVAGVRRYAMKDGKEVAMVDRVTPTKGKELGFLEQLFGNVGRFNK